MYTKQQVISSIILHFGSRKACAEALKIKESTLSRNLDKLTLKFIERLKKIGIVIVPEGLKLKLKEPEASYLANTEELRKKLNDQEKIIAILVDKITYLEKEKISLLDQTFQLNKADKKASKQIHILKPKR